MLGRGSEGVVEEGIGKAKEKRQVQVILNCKASGDMSEREKERGEGPKTADGEWTPPFLLIISSQLQLHSHSSYSSSPPPPPIYPPDYSHLKLLYAP